MSRRLAALAAVLLAACAATPQEPPGARADAGPTRTAYVVRHGWHSGLVLRVADLPGASPLVRDFPDAEHVEVGWGDRVYYPAPQPTIWMAMRAVLWPTPGVLHVVGFRGAPQANFPASQIVEVPLSDSGFERLHARLRDSFELDAAGNTVVLGPGLYGESRFYASREFFHLFKTCNVWTAQVLREAGLPLTPATALSAGSLIRQLEPLGRSNRP